MALSKSLVLISIGLLCANLKSVSCQRHEATLDPEGRFVVGWIVTGDIITFDVAVQSLGFFGLGISDTGNMYGLDCAIGMVLENGTAVIMDYVADGNFRPQEDFVQDVQLLYGYESDTHTYMRFSRALDTGDDFDDVAITDRDTYLVYSIGFSDVISYHETRGSYAVNLLRPGAIETYAK